MEIGKELDRRRRIVEIDLRRFLPRGGSRIECALGYAVLNGGKRVRGILSRATAALFGAGSAAASPLAAAIEFLHAYSLVHDDLPAMDDDDFRRGKPSCHRKFDEATAILAGDGLQALAFSCLAGLRPASRVPLLVRRIADAVGWNGMVGGQMEDLVLEGRNAARAAIDRMQEKKTGELLAASVVSGAILAGAGGEDIARMERYGKGIGKTFQIVDDILNVTSTTKALGKSAGSDAKAKKSTYASLLGVDRARRTAEGWTRKAVAALSPYGPRARFLREVAFYLLWRER